MVTAGAVAAVAVRVVAAAVLVFGPWTDQVAELSGWDVERFQEIADADGRHWVDQPVEYPPGSVVVFETIAQGSAVGTHRVLVALSLVVDLGVAALLAKAVGRRPAVVYLLLGLPLVPMGLLRLDLWSVAAAAGAAIALAKRKPAVFAGLATVAALIKAWPVFLLGAAIALGRRTATVAALAAMAIAGLAWLAYAGWSLDPIEQVLSLRGATGWHLESVGGSLAALFTDEQPELQLNAYRIGSRNEFVVRAGQVLTVTTLGALTMLGARTLRHRAADHASASRTSAGLAAELQVVALIMVGATAALMVTAPLLSPQFLLWLTPWAALLATPTAPTNPKSGHPDQNPSPLDARISGVVGVVWSVGVATTITGFTLLVFGPPDVGAAVPALLLLARDGLLIAVVVLALRALAGSSDRTEDPLGQRGSGPRPAGANP